MDWGFRGAERWPYRAKHHPLEGAAARNESRDENVVAQANLEARRDIRQAAARRRGNLLREELRLALQPNGVRGRRGVLNIAGRQKIGLVWGSRRHGQDHGVRLRTHYGLDGIVKSGSTAVV